MISGSSARIFRSFGCLTVALQLLQVHKMPEATEFSRFSPHLQCFPHFQEPRDPSPLSDCVNSTSPIQFFNSLTSKVSFPLLFHFYSVFLPPPPTKTLPLSAILIMSLPPRAGGVGISYFLAIYRRSRAPKIRTQL